MVREIELMRHMDEPVEVAQQVVEAAGMAQEDLTYPEFVSQCILLFHEIHMTLDIPSIRSHEFGSLSVINQRGYTIVPYVIRPISAVGGSKLRLTMRVSFNTCKSVSSRHVSITYKKIGGVDADLFKMYSIVVNCGCNSRGKFPG
jgi:hypothetical protein